MKLSLVSEVTNSEPVTLSEAKDFLRIKHNAEDSLISSYIKAARSHAEYTTGLCLTQQTWLQRVVGFYDKSIQIYRSPVQSVSSISYYDTEQNLVVLDSSNYNFIKNDRISYIELVDGKTWPSVAEITLPVSIQFIAGGVAIDDMMRIAILQHVGFMYENRQQQPPPAGIDNLLRVNRIYYC